MIGIEPWAALIAKLGLGGSLGRDAVLDALNAAGEATGLPLIIFIDALNETQPDRRRWQVWLPPMLEQVKRRPFLKLCVSCRESYVREVMPPRFEIPVVEHNGFLGKEYEAQFAFFQYYGLGVPAEPLLQEEFANPLFLRLVCEALRDSAAQAIPAGREGIRTIINLLLQAKNQRAAAACDYDPRDNRVSKAMLRLAGAMATTDSRALPLSEARSLVDPPGTMQSQSLFAILESESLVSTIEQPGSRLGDEPSYSVRFTFERVGDHLIAEHLLQGVADARVAFAAGGRLHFLVVNEGAARSNAGLLEALSIQLPEAHGVELIDILDGDHESRLWPSFIAGLQWRNPQHIGDRAVALVRRGLASAECLSPMMEALFGLAARPHHPLNAGFLDYILQGVPLLERDPFWANCRTVIFGVERHDPREKRRAPAYRYGLHRPPYRSAWPIVLPSEDEVRTYAEDQRRFPQMSLAQKIGFATGTDFARYVVEPRVTTAFNTEGAGLDKLGIFRWFLQRAVESGYPGPREQCALFDRVLLSNFGGGRGKPGWAERLGKKYYWIFLRQLVGQVADHVDHTTWSATLSPSSELQGLDLQVIDMHEAWSGKRTGSTRTSTYRHVTRDIRAVACSAGDIKKVTRAFNNDRLEDLYNGPHDYRGYLGEYPHRWPYIFRASDPVTFGRQDEGIAFQHLVLRQLRGREWERDYSHIGESETLLMPSTALVHAGNLRWDRRGGWQAPDGLVKVQDPWWWSDQSAALICRLDFMDHFLQTHDLALIVLCSQMKTVLGHADGGGRVTEKTLFVRHRGRTRRLKRKLERD